MLGKCRKSRGLWALSRIRVPLSTIVYVHPPPAQLRAELCPSALADLQGCLSKPLDTPPKPTPAPDRHLGHHHTHIPWAAHAEPAPTQPASSPGCPRYHMHWRWLQLACQKHPTYTVYTEIAHTQGHSFKIRRDSCFV